MAQEKVSFCQVDAHLDTNPKIRKAGRDGRDVFEFMLRTIAKLHLDDGCVPIQYLDPDYLADVLMMPLEAAVTGVTRAVTSNLIRIDEGRGVAIVVGWTDEWGRKAMSVSERVANHRARKILETKQSHPVGNDHVTVGNESNECNASEERRGEEIREEITASPSPALNSVSPKPPRAKRAPNRVTLPDDWAPKPSHIAKCVELGIDCAAQAEKFRLNALAKGHVYANWDAAFFTWIGNSVTFRDRDTIRSGGSSALQPRTIPEL